jgi:hypothetical protein
MTNAAHATVRTHDGRMADMEALIGRKAMFHACRQSDIGT